MRAAKSYIRMADAVAHNDEFLCQRRFSLLLNHSVVVGLSMTWHDEQASGIYEATDFDTVFAMPRHAPPR